MHLARIRNLGLALTTMVTVCSCAISNPDWRRLSEESQRELRTLLKNESTTLYYTDEIRSTLDRMDKVMLADDEDVSEKEWVLNKNLLKEPEYLYRPGKVKRTKERSFSDLTFSIITDRGVDDPGEIDLFEDGELAVSIDFIGGDYVPDILNFVRTDEDVEWRSKRWYRQLIPRAIGFTANLGGGTTNAGTNSSAYFALLSGGVYLQWLDFLGIEAGYLFGISPEEGLNSSQRDDSALYYGIRVDVDRFQEWAKALWEVMT